MGPATGTDDPDPAQRPLRVGVARFHVQEYLAVHRLAIPPGTIPITFPAVLQTLRSRCVALATLAAFLVAQPAALCAALCVFERHHPAAHTMAGINHGTSAVDGAACHSGVTDATEHYPIQVLAPMAPARAVVIAAAPEQRVEPLWTLPTFPRPVSRTAEPPPPRFV